ncbi:conjugal transfer protein TrbF [Sphingomonas sp. 1P08PE]|uniref:conjugal transfer protein TrbF n=1 Tax=Sphingomonas sp. 1P08PE TaxID=554122 RepID=UPI0039A15080
MYFKRSVQRYGRSPEPVTPYQRAGQVWDDRIGAARIQARNWRAMAFGLLVCSGGLSAALIWQSLQSRVVPYVVAVDQLGEARAISEAEATYRPTDAQIAWQLARFVENVRSISLDPVLMRRDWLSAYDFATQRGAAFLGDYARSADPFAGIGDRSVSVQVTSVVRSSDTSFQVKWTESAFNRGKQTGVSHWTGILSVVMKPPNSAETLRKNPLGLYVDAIDWSRELEPAGPTTAMVEPTRPPDNLPLGSPLDPMLALPTPATPQRRTLP